MQSDIDVDLEELESRLYSQVFHSSEIYQQEQPNLDANNTDPTNRHISNYTISKRYFTGKKVADARPQTAQPTSTTTPLETIDCSKDQQQNATDIHNQSRKEAANAISKKQKRKNRKAKQRKNRKLTNGTVINPVNQARQTHVYNLRSRNRPQQQLVFKPLRNKTFADARKQGNEASNGPLLYNTGRPKSQLIEEVHNQQVYDVRQSGNQARHVPPLMGVVINPQIVNIRQTTSYVPPLMGLVDNQQLFNMQPATQIGHVPPFPGLVANQQVINVSQPANQRHAPSLINNQQFGDSMITGKQTEYASPIARLVDNRQFVSGNPASHEPATQNAHSYDARWTSIKMPISKQDLCLPDLSRVNQTTTAAGVSSIRKQTTPEPFFIRQTTITNQNLTIAAPSIITAAKPILPTHAPISQKVNPMNQSESDFNYVKIMVRNPIADVCQFEASNKTDDDFIVLSDSDDSVILVPPPTPIIYLVDDSSEELDYVGSTNLELEHLDPAPNCANETQNAADIQTISSPDIQNVCSSLSPEICETIHLETEVVPLEISSKATEITEIERIELLFTPDSNTNDFIENDVDTLNKRGSGFNFNLHGSDLDLNRLEKPSVHASRPDVYETESSCSEAGPVTKIFSEVDFELPTKEIFCEPDLASFSKFITPSRKVIEPDLTPILDFIPVKSKALRKKQLSLNSENDNCLDDTEYNSDSTSLVVKKKNKKKKKKEKRKQLEDEASNIVQNIDDAFNSEVEVVQQKKKDKRKKSEDETNEIMYNENENVTLKKKNTRKKSNEEPCEQAEIISGNLFNNETENAQKKKNKRKKIDKDICEQTDELQVFKKSENTHQKKKEKRKKLDDAEICEQIDSPTKSNNDTEIVTKKKKEKRKKVDEEFCAQIDPSSSNNETEDVIQKKKDRRKKQEDESNSEPSSDIVDDYQQNTIEKVQIKKKDKRKKFDDTAGLQTDPIVANPNENETGNTQKKEKRKKDEVTWEQVEFTVNNSLNSETQNAPQKKKDKRKKMEDETTSEQMENKMETSPIEAVIEDTSQKSEPVVEHKPEVDSIQIDCDTGMTNKDEECVQPDSIVNFSFMSAWNEIQPSTSGKDQESIIKNESETLTLSDSPQIANTFNSKDGLEIITTTPQMVKESYHSPKDSEPNTKKISDNLKLLSPKALEVNTKIVSNSLTDSIPTSKESQIPTNIELESGVAFENSKESSKNLKDFQQISKVIKDHIESSKEAPHISNTLESKTKKDTGILEDFPQMAKGISQISNAPETSENVHQIALPNSISKEAQKTSKTPDLITKKIPSQTSQQCETTEMPNAGSKSKILSQVSKKIPQTSRQSPPDVSQVPKTADKTKKYLPQTLTEIPQTSTQSSLTPDIPLKVKSKIQTFISQTFKESIETSKQIPSKSNLSHSSKNAPPIIDLTENDYIPISFRSDSKMNPKQASEKISTNIILNVSSPKQSTSKESKKKMVANPFGFADSDRRTFGDFWTDDMKKFYEDSWGQENYDINTVLSSMPSDESKWKIIVEDKFGSRSPRKRGPVCQKCREVGHSRYNCTRYPGPLKCAICGAAGHFHARCPYLMCTSCGNQGGYFTTSCSKCAHYRKIICSLCNSVGHQNTKCPDLWRRYHLTTEDLPILKSNTLKLKPNNKRWCSNCARRGHLQNVCTFMNTEHFPTMPHIISYDPCYNRIFNISPAAQPENIPTMFENTNLSQIRDYKNKMLEFNRNRYLHLLKVLKHQCRSSNLPYIPEIERMERALQRDQNPKNIIGNIYKLRSLIQKGNMWK